MIRIGIDVGGTNTDAVIMDGDTLLAAHKTATTADISSGVVDVMRKVLTEAAIAPTQVQAVMIGTTHFVNAVVERRRLSPTAVVRVAAPATFGLPPMVGWPADLRDIVAGPTFIVGGGSNVDGGLIQPLDETAVEDAARAIAACGIRTAAVAAVFSPLSDEVEARVREILLTAEPELEISCSAEIGRLGLLERENAAVLNGALRPVARDVMASFERAIAAAGIDAPLHISQNDGTVMDSAWAMKYPILTFASGPTNSMRGAAYLTGESDTIVVDIGGTTTDIGAIIGGFPREASAELEIAGVRTNFRMPDVISIGLGGGSIVTRSDDGEVTIGPRSVGYALTTKALVFGGDVCTATDIAVAAGHAVVGDPGLVSHLDDAFVQRAVETMSRMIEEGIDRVKLRSEDVPVIVAGGGSILVGGDLGGATSTIRPRHAGVANAIGAALGQVSGEVDQVVTLDGTDRRSVIDAVIRRAVDKTVAAGADRSSVVVQEVEEIPLAYMPTRQMVRLRVRAVGSLTPLSQAEVARP